MSRVGRQPIDIGSNVKVVVDKANKVTVTGPKGTLSEQINPDLGVEQEQGQLIVKRPTDSRHHRAQHGLARALINNMVVGVTQGFTRKLEVRGTGYRAEQQGGKLVLQVGKSHSVEFVPPNKTITFEVAKDGRSFEIRGIDKREVGELAAVIRKTRPPEPYKGKGVRYDGEFVRTKTGKTGRS